MTFVTHDRYERLRWEDTWFTWHCHASWVWHFHPYSKLEKITIMTSPSCWLTQNFRYIQVDKLPLNHCLMSKAYLPHFYGKEHSFIIKVIQKVFQKIFRKIISNISSLFISFSWNSMVLAKEWETGSFLPIILVDFREEQQ